MTAQASAALASLISAAGNRDMAEQDQVVAAVRADLLSRSEMGIAKYGVTLDRTDLNLRDWLQHAYEETLDQANYLKRAIIEIDQEGAAHVG
jgi:hypothetical protein